MMVGEADTKLLDFSRSLNNSPLFLFSFLLRVNMSTASLLKGRSGTFDVCIGSMGLSSRNFAHTEHFAIASLISPFIPGQRTASRAFLNHASMPR